MTASGYRLVPFDPVDEMLDAAETVDFANEDERAFACNLWHAMVAAAPQPEPQHLTRNQQAAVQQALIASGEHLYDVRPEPPADLVEKADKAWIDWATGRGTTPVGPEFLAAFAQEHAAAEKARADKAETERDAWRKRESETQEALQALGEEFGVRGGEPRVDGVRRVLTELRNRADASERLLEKIATGKEVRYDDGYTELVDFDPGEASDIAEEGLATIRATFKEQ